MINQNAVLQQILKDWEEYDEHNDPILFMQRMIPNMEDAKTSIDEQKTSILQKFYDLIKREPFKNEGLISISFFATYKDVKCHGEINRTHADIFPAMSSGDVGSGCGNRIRINLDKVTEGQSTTY